MDQTVENGGAPTGLQALAREIRAAAKPDTVFGEPIRHGGITLVPVAKASFGLGGGFREGRRRGGAGGGSSIRPVGFIVMNTAGARFHPISTGWTQAAVLGLAIGLWLGKRRRR